MYRYIILWCTLCSFLAQEKLSAQSINRVISEQFETEIYDFGRLSDGKWIFAVKISPLPDALADISLAVIITDSLGVQIKTIPVPIIFPGERYEIRDLFILPNDEFLITDMGGDCDSDLREGAIQKLDTTGTVLWSFRVSTYSSLTPTGTTPDGNIIGFYGNSIRSISSLTSAMLWESKLDSIPNHYNSRMIMPGTDNLLVGDEEGLKIYEKNIFGSEIKYVLKHSQSIEMDSGYITQLISAGDGLFYALKSDTREIIRFRDDLVPETILTCPAYTSFFPKPNGLVLTRYQNGDIQEFSIYDTLWVKLDSFKIELPGVEPRKFAAFNDGLAVVGKYTSGSNTSDYPDDLYRSGRRQGWLGFYKDYNVEETNEIFSLSIKDMIEEDSIIIDSVYDQGPDYTGYIYSFSGGKFKVKILNTGTLPIDSFWINTVFNEWTNYWFCAPASATQHKYVIGKLLPGDSTWVEFGDFDAMRQSVLPVEFCFWTSGPNQHPDDLPDDDLYCFNSKLHFEYPPLGPIKYWTEGIFRPDNNGWISRRFRYDSIPEIRNGKLYHSFSKSYKESGDFWISDVSLVREEANRIFRYTEPEDEILCDFNLSVGDTFHLSKKQPFLDLLVIKVDSIQLLNGDIKKRLLLEGLNPNEIHADDNHITWIEGIGNLNGFYSNYLPWSPIEETTILLCMNWDSILVYDNPDFESCWLMTTSTNEIGKEKIYFSPNPATEEITLQGFEGEVENIKIYNANGRLLIQVNNSNIKLNDFPPGYYYAVVLFKNSQIRTLGFVKS